MKSEKHWAHILILKMVDNQHLRELAIISFRIEQLAHDRGFDAEALDETDALIDSKAKAIFQSALDRKCSLSEIVSKTFEKEGSRLLIECLDRN